MYDAINYLVNEGAVTDACMPYVSPSLYPECPNNLTTRACKDGSQWIKYKCKKDSIKKYQGSENIKGELFLNGPLTARFTVYDDFHNYKKGIYSHVTGNGGGGHFVKVIGWGVEDKGAEGKINYWVCANSWGPNWGENGFFRIKEGDSGINDLVYGC